MKPGHAHASFDSRLRARRDFLAMAISGLAVSGLSSIGVVSLSGCSGPAMRSQSPEQEIEAIGSKIKLVGDVAVPSGLFPVRVEAIGLVTGLDGTGSDPVPSPQRASLLDEMQTRGVINPQRLLASPNTALVTIRGNLRPGIQRGDHFDLEVRSAARDDTTSLRGGKLLEVRMREFAVREGEIREGIVLALGEGAILVDPSATEKTDKEKLRRGRILGGGVCQKDRPLMLVLKPGSQNVKYSSQIGVAVNRRFSTYDKGIKSGVANPQNDKYIRMIVHPRYKDNIERYMQVVRGVAIREDASQQLTRLALLERQLMDPITSAAAAIKLEAVGKQGIDVLKKGVATKDREVKFYSAEALAYLDQTEACEPLAAAAKEEPAFRAYALTALSSMDDFAAFEALRTLLHVPSAETRYGAFRALWAMNESDPLVRGENLGGQFGYHILTTTGPDMVHVTRSHRPEIVLFGHEQVLKTPLVLDAGKKIMLRSTEPGKIVVSRFATNEGDQKRVISARLDEVIRTIVELGGTYPDVVQALQQAKVLGALTARLEMDALPQGGRRYTRQSGEESEEGEEMPISDEPEIVAAGKLPAMFASTGSDDKVKKRRKRDKKLPEPEEKGNPVSRFFGKMRGKKDDSSSESSSDE